MYGTYPPKNAKIGGFWILVLDGIPWGLIGTAGFSTQWATVVGSQFFLCFWSFHFGVWIFDVYEVCLLGRTHLNQDIGVLILDSRSWGLDFGVLILGPNRMVEFC